MFHEEQRANLHRHESMQNVSVQLLSFCLLKNNAEFKKKIYNKQTKKSHNNRKTQNNKTTHQQQQKQPQKEPTNQTNKKPQTSGVVAAGVGSI